MSEHMFIPTSGFSTEEFPYNAAFVRRDELDVAIRHAQEVQTECRNVALATASPDGVPLNTVVGSGFPPALSEPGEITIAEGVTSIFWSYPDARHIRNIRQAEERGLAVNASILIFSALRNKGSLTVEAHVREVPPESFAERLDVLNAIRKYRGIGPPKSDTEFDPGRPGAARLYEARPVRLSVPVRGYNITDRHTLGRRTRTRYAHESNVQYPIRPEGLQTYHA